MPRKPKNKDIAPIGRSTKTKSSSGKSASSKAFNFDEAMKQIKKLEDYLNSKFFGRSEVIKDVIIALLGGENLLLVAPTGTAKSSIIEEMARSIGGGRYYRITLNKYSEKDELLGPYDIKKWRDEGVLERRTEGFLPDADIVFLDEVMRASPPILDMLLEMLAEGQVRGVFGKETAKTIKALAIYGATNFVEVEDESYDPTAFLDRFMKNFHGYVEEDPRYTWVEIVKMLAKKGVSLINERVKRRRGIISKVQPLIETDVIRKLQVEVADRISKMIDNVPSDLWKAYAKAIKLLRQQDLNYSDRNIARTMYIAGLHAIYNGRDYIDGIDVLYAIRKLIPTSKDELATIERTLQGVIPLNIGLAQRYRKDTIDALSAGVNELEKKASSMLKDLDNIIKSAKSRPTTIFAKGVISITRSDYNKLKKSISEMIQSISKTIKKVEKDLEELQKKNIPVENIKEFADKLKVEVLKPLEDIQQNLTFPFATGDVVNFAEKDWREGVEKPLKKLEKTIAKLKEELKEL